MENRKELSKSGPDVAALIAGAIALAATAVWVFLWIAPLPDESGPRPREEAPAAPKAEAARPDIAQAPSAPPVASAEEPPVAQSAPTVSVREKPLTIRPPSPSPTTRSKPVEEAPPPAQQLKLPEPSRNDPALEALPGRYVGNYFEGGSEAVGMTLDITSVERGDVKGTATLGGQGCSGDYPMRGSYRDSRLELRATRNGGPAGDCPLRLSLSVDAGRLTGTTGSGNGVELSK